MIRVEHEAAKRAEHAGIFRIVDELARDVETFLESLTIDHDDGLAVVKSSLLLRLATGLEALGLLASRGYFTEALVQERSLMEALARLAALCKKPELLDEYLMQDELNRVKILNDIMQFRSKFAPDEAREPHDEDLIATLKSVEQSIDAYNQTATRTLRDIKTFHWAKLGEVEHLFHGQYTISSQASHHAPRDLLRRFVVRENDLTGIVIGPEPGEISKLLLDACKFVFVGLQWFAISVGLDVPESIDALYQLHAGTYERLANEARERAS